MPVFCCGIKDCGGLPHACVLPYTTENGHYYISFSGQRTRAQTFLFPYSPHYPETQPRLLGYTLEKYNNSVC